LCVRGSNGSKKKEQNPRADKSNWFHVCRLHYGDFTRPGHGYCFWCLPPAEGQISQGHSIFQGLHLPTLRLLIRYPVIVGDDPHTPKWVAYEFASKHGAR
jgi:hypothetical protein